ncbi:hypothetical protein K8I28_06040 [bacterium]|nr:hypothetical protein [bacterium]
MSGDNNNTKMYILDTSSIRSMKFDDIRTISSCAELAVSPITVFEFLCHIDEFAKKEKHLSNGELSRLHSANFLKCRELKILDDPYAEQAQKVGAQAAVEPSRFEDRLVLPKLYEALESSSTLEEFFSKEVIFPSGETALLRDVAERTRIVLEDMENKYCDYIKSLCTEILEQFSFEGSQRMTSVNFVELIGSSSIKIAEEYALEIEQTELRELKGSVFSALFPNLGYCISRSIEYLRRANGDIERLNIDGNDMEDSAICLHLSLLENRILVTGDGGTLQALKTSIEKLNEASETLQQSVTANADVISTDSFKELFLSD